MRERVGETKRKINEGAREGVALNTRIVVSYELEQRYLPFDIPCPPGLRLRVDGLSIYVSIFNVSISIYIYIYLYVYIYLSANLYIYI